jgi:hypothetical protein
VCAAAPPPIPEPAELDIGEITPAPQPVTEQVTPSSQALEFRIRLARELARGFLAFVLALIFGMTVWWAFRSAGTSSWNDTKQLLDVLIPTESALLGTAVAFFFSAL